MEKPLGNLLSSYITFILFLGLSVQPGLAQTGVLSGLFNEQEQQWIKEHPVITIGVDGNWPPIDFYDEQGNFKGVTAEYLDLISQKTGISFTPHKSTSFKKMLQKVIDGDLKAGATISYTDERSKKLLFSKPFFQVHKVIFTRSASPIKNMHDLQQKTVAIEDGYLTMRQLQKKHPKIKLLAVNSTLEALQKVSWGEADAYIGNQAVASWLILENQLTNLIINGNPQLGSGPQNFAVPKKAPEWAPLIGIIDKSLASIPLEQKQAIQNRWIKRPVEPAGNILPLELDSQEKAWLNNHPQIYIGVDPAWKPLEFIDENDHYSGLSSEFMKFFSQQLGIQFQPPEPMPWIMVIKGLRDKTIDIAPMVVKTEKRSQYLNFTKQYIDFPIVIFNRRGETLLGGINDLQGKKLGLVRGYAISDIIYQDYPDIEQVEYTDAQAGLQALSTRKIDAFIGVQAVGGYLIATEGMSNLQVASSTPLNYPLSIGVRKDWPQLVSILNKAIDHLSAQQKNKFLKNWLAVHQAQKIDYSLFLWAVTVAFIIITLLGLRHRELGKINTQLKEGRQRLALTLESANLGTWELSYIKNDIIHIEWDENFARHHALPTDQHSLNENDFGLIISPKYENRVVQSLKKYMRGEQQQFKVEYQSKSSHRWISSQGRILKQDDKRRLKRIVGISQDITESKEASLQIERSSHFKSQFLANMSHEIRTPMNAIAGLGHLLAQTRIDDQQSDYINNLQKSSQTLLALIDDILDLSKIEAGHLNIENIQFSLEELLNDLANISVIRIQKKIEFIYDMRADVPDVLKGDPFRINQILTNLVSNAIKFTEAGNIILRVSVFQHKQNSDDPLWLQFEVSDTGIGIAPDKLGKLFDPFVQEDGSTTRKYGGTGLGLSISRQLAKLMGGTLEVKSKQGSGSQFYCRLPFYIGKSDIGHTLLTSPSPDVRGLQVLLVDDNPLSLKILTRTLESMSFVVTQAASGKQALQILHLSADKNFDVVLLDWRMPEMDGEKTAIKIRKLLPEDSLPIIILMTAYGREAAEQKIDRLSLDGFLVKPITPSQIFNAIIQARKGYHSSHHKHYDLPQDHQIMITPLEGHVLLAEDNHINQQVAREILQQMGLRVSICENGVQVINEFDIIQPNLILMDIQMPEMDGYQATRKIRQTQTAEDLPIIAMTANAMSEDIQKSIQSGMNDHISKPVDPQILYQTLSRYLSVKEKNSTAQQKQQNSTTSVPGWPDNLPGLNIKQGIKQVGGNESLYQNLVTDFAQKYQHLVETLEQSVKQDPAKAKRLIHTIKGVSGNIGANRLMLVATEIENNFKHQSAIPKQLINSLRVTCEELFGALQPLIEKQPHMVATKQENIITLTDENLKQLTTALLQGDSTCAKLIQQFTPALKTAIGEESLSTLSALVNEYEFEKAQEYLLNQIQNKQND